MKSGVAVDCFYFFHFPSSPGARMSLRFADILALWNDPILKWEMGLYGKRGPRFWRNPAFRLIIYSLGAGLILPLLLLYRFLLLDVPYDRGLLLLMAMMSIGLMTFATLRTHVKIKHLRRGGLLEQLWLTPMRRADLVSRLGLAHSLFVLIPSLAMSAGLVFTAAVMLPAQGGWGWGWSWRYSMPRDGLLILAATLPAWAIWLVSHMWFDSLRHPASRIILGIALLGGTVLPICLPLMIWMMFELGIYITDLSQIALVVLLVLVLVGSHLAYRWMEIGELVEPMAWEDTASGRPLTRPYGAPPLWRLLIRRRPPSDLSQMVNRSGVIVFFIVFPAILIIPWPPEHLLKMTAVAVVLMTIAIVLSIRALVKNFLSALMPLSGASEPPLPPFVLIQKHVLLGLIGLALLFAVFGAWLYGVPLLNLLVEPTYTKRGMRLVVQNSLGEQIFKGAGMGLSVWLMVSSGVLIYLLRCVRRRIFPDVVAGDVVMWTACIWLIVFSFFSALLLGLLEVRMNESMRYYMLGHFSFVRESWFNVALSPIGHGAYFGLISCLVFFLPFLTLLSRRLVAALHHWQDSNVNHSPDAIDVQSHPNR